VPLSGPILTLSLLGTLAGNVVAPLAYLVNVSNGFLVTVLVWVAEAASALPIAAVATPGALLPLVGLFYLGCVPAALAEATLPDERWLRVAGLLVMWPRSGSCSSPSFETTSRCTRVYCCSRGCGVLACGRIRGLRRG
jgi:hypothetical protein